MQKERVVLHRGIAHALLLMGTMVAASANAMGQQERTAPPPVGVAPEPLSWPAPDYRYEPIQGDDYPPSAIRQHHEGTVDVLATLDHGGKVIEAKISKSSGYRELDRAAMTTVEARHFPACTPKVPTHDKCLVAMLVEFHLPKP